MTASKRLVTFVGPVLSLLVCVGCAPPQDADVAPGESADIAYGDATVHIEPVDTPLMPSIHVSIRAASRDFNGADVLSDAVRLSAPVEQYGEGSRITFDSLKEHDGTPIVMFTSDGVREDAQPLDSALADDGSISAAIPGGGVYWVEVESPDYGSSSDAAAMLLLLLLVVG